MTDRDRQSERGKFAPNVKGQRAELKPTPRTASRAVLKKVTTSLEPDVHIQLKIISAQSGQSIEALLRDAVSELIEKYNAPDPKGR
jgi:hypothetical protein